MKTLTIAWRGRTFTLTERQTADFFQALLAYMADRGDEGSTLVLQLQSFEEESDGEEWQQ